MAPTRATYIKMKREAANREAAIKDPMNQAKVNKAEPKGLKGLLGAKKKFFDSIASERNKIADKKMQMNRLPNAANNYK